MKQYRRLKQKVRHIRRGKPVLPYNEFDADNQYWDNYNGDCIHLIASKDKHHTFLEHVPMVKHCLRHFVVLDLGCGVGRLNLWYDIKEYHGLDTNPKMLEKARELNKDKTNATFHHGDGYTLSQFPDTFFDVVISNTVFLHLRVRTAVSYVDEVWRVLKPNGEFMLNLPRKHNLDTRALFSRFQPHQQISNLFKNDNVFWLSKLG